MKYYISDLHLFHENAIKFDHRPFDSVQEMHEVVLKNWNDRVTNGDFVYLLGDMSLRGKNEDLIAFVARLKGRKVLIILVNDSVEGTAFVVDALFHPVLKNAIGMNERELKIAREIREGIIKYLSDEEGE